MESMQCWFLIETNGCGGQWECWAHLRARGGGGKVETILIMMVVVAPFGKARGFSSFCFFNVICKVNE
ncbi:hypothetical protein Mapa_001942 [Marchantia paleacea]|nr:hypothetical protein Mapa_001942 [Marchantia paleacea]